MGLFKKKPPNNKNKILTTATILGIICLAFYIVTIFTDPVLIIAKYFTRVDYGTFIHKALNAPFYGIHISAYLFNVTNAERFLAGLDYNLKVEEVGPFTYQEIRTNELLEIDHKKHVMRYSPKITTRFIPEESIGNPKDINVTMPNIAMLSFGSKIGSYSFIPRMGFNMLTSRLRSKAIVTKNAADYLWGYEEPLIKLGNTILPGWINFDTLGVLDRLYDKKARYLFEVGANGDDRFMIKTVNGSGGLDMWGYGDTSERNICNTFENTYEGIGYPNELTPESTLRIYINVLCRIYELDFHSIKDTEYGTKGLVYKISNRTFTKNEATKCLCKYGVCEDGLSDLSPCFVGFPVVLSNAHFLYADPKLYSRIEGIKPDEESHGSSFVIEPKIGMALETIFSVQVNLKLKDLGYNSEISKFSNMLVPVAYFKIVQPKLLDQPRYNLKLIYSIGPSTLLAFQIVLLILGLGLLSNSVIQLFYYWIRCKRKDIQFHCDIRRSASENLMKKQILSNSLSFDS